jgi:hypothetical protein
LRAAKEQVDKSEAEKAEVRLAARAEEVDAFHKEAKIVPAMLDKEKEFVQSLSDEQFGKYVEIKESMPSIVELDKEAGSQTSNEPAETEAKQKEKVTQKADDLVMGSLLRQGYSKEEADKLLKETKK